jgi:hypothetical protein
VKETFMTMSRAICVFIVLLSAISAAAQTPCVWSTDQTGKIVETCGSVGIGTTAPDRDLQVINGGSSGRGIEVANTAGSARKEVLLSIDGSYAYLDSYNFGGPAPYPLKVQVNGGNTLLNPVSGYVGIGTVSPHDKLEVWGNARFGNDFATMPLLQFGGVMIGQYGGGATGELQFLSAASGNGYGFRLHGYSGDGSFRLDRRANSDTFTDFVTFTPGGNVGIGTMSPGSSLTVAGFIESISNGFKFPDGSVQTSAYPAGTFSTSGSNVGIGTSPLNRLHVYSTASADGISVDGTTSPAVNFRNSGTVKAYLGLATGTGAFSADAVANDLVIRSESNNILLGRGSGRATLAIVGGNVGVGLTDMVTYINSGSYFKPAANGTHFAAYSASSEAVFNAMSYQDANGAHIGGLYFTRIGGQSDAHYQIAAIQGRQSGTGGLAGGDLWFFTKPTGAGGGADNARMVIKQSGHIVIGDPNMTDTAILNVAGDINVSGNINAKYQDVAEWVSAGTKLDVATVVVLDPSRDDQVMPSSRAYDTTVAGVVSASPGIILGVGGDGKEKIATTGRVKVRVDATRAPIAIGDLLVTSDVPGMAMRSEAIEVGGAKIHRPGTVIGKALQALPTGHGEILVLLSLQ